MSEAWYDLLKDAAFVLMGFILGSAVKWRKGKHNGHDVVSPTISRTPRSIAMLAIVMTMLSLLTVFNSATSTNKQRDCNAEFQRVINERSQYTQAADDALYQMVREIYQDATNTNRGDTDFVESLNAYLEAQASVNQARRDNPYPDPRC